MYNNHNGCRRKLSLDCNYKVRFSDNESTLFVRCPLTDPNHVEDFFRSFLRSGKVEYRGDVNHKERNTSVEST